MKKFILTTVLFFSILLLFFIAGLMMPATPRASGSLLFSQFRKDSLLKNVKPPRVVFIGGSNLSFGLNSKMFKDSSGLNPINTAIHYNLGLTYMLDHNLPLIQKGDIVIVAPEYDQFFGKNTYGWNELLRIIFDVNPSRFSQLRFKQWVNIAGFIPKYALSKFSYKEYVISKNKDFDRDFIYGSNSFNEYGDSYIHWKLGREKIRPVDSITEKFNQDVIDDLLYFKNKIQEKGAVLFLTYPCYQDISFQNNRTQIMKIESELKKNNFLILGTPERYKMPDSLLYNTVYHLTKTGVDLRTRLLLQDLRKISR